MTTEFEFEKKMKQRNLAVRESRLTMRIGLLILASIAIYALLAYFIEPAGRMTPLVENIYMVFCVIAVGIVIVVLAVRRTIYFSPRLVGENMDLATLLGKWRIIDITLFACAESMALMGLIVRYLGVPFPRTLSFFAGSFLLVLVLMPFTFKVMDKIRYFERQNGR